MARGTRRDNHRAACLVSIGARPLNPANMNAAALNAATMVDSDHPAVIAFAREHACGTDDRERAVALYYAVRDGFRYDPYRVDLSVAGMTASTVLANGYGWCVPKAALLAAACRAAKADATQLQPEAQRGAKGHGGGQIVWRGAGMHGAIVATAHDKPCADKMPP